MAQPFSDETQELLDRAQRPLDRAVETKCQTRRCIAQAKNRTYQLELSLYRQRASQFCQE